MINKKTIISFLLFLCVTGITRINAQVEIVSTGTGSAYVLNVPAVFPLRNGVQVTFKSHVVSVASPTINVTGTGAILIKKDGGSSNLAAGDIKANQVVTLAYDGSFWQMLSASGNSPASGSVTGSGTQNYVTKWNNAGGTSIGNSTIFDDGTNVSIGTTTASSLFHVRGGGTPQITIENTAGNFKTGYRIKTGLNEWFLGQESDATTGFRITDIDAGLARFQIDQTGNVGIGITSPISKLHVANETNDAIVIQVSSDSDSGEIAALRSRGTIAAPTAIMANDMIGSLTFAGYNGTVFTGASFIYSTAAENFTNLGTGSELKFSTTSIGSTGPSQRMIIKQNGYVGIGTEAPFSHLHVAGDNPNSIINQVAGATPSVQSGIVMMRSRGTILAPDPLLSGDYLGSFAFLGYDGTDFGSPVAEIGAKAEENYTSSAKGTSMTFSTNPIGSASGTERMIINSAGNVGIGT
ncbi:MAG TPA: hypothetical protein VF679_02605, partial [Pedobacter sp.]